MSNVNPWSTINALKPASKELIMQFLDNFPSVNTRDAYRVDIQDFLEFFNRKFQHPNEVTLSDAILYRDHLIDTKSSATAHRKLASVKSLFNWCANTGIVSINPIASLKMPKTMTEMPTLAFTDAEALNLLELPDTSTFTGNMHRLVLSFLFNLGLRRSELVNIKLSDIYEDRGVQVIRIQGKGSKQRILPLSDKVKLDLKTYILNYTNYVGVILNQEDFLLQTSVDRRNEKPVDGSTIYRIVNRYAKAADISKRVGAHSCRATVISQLLENQISPRDVADFAGHSNIQTTIGSYDKKRDGLKNSAALKVNYGT